MENKIPVQCPSCEKTLKVQKLKCVVCNTEVSGQYELPLLVCLAPKEQEFILEFVKSSGSLKIMAQKMKLSYPTVRNILDAIIEKIQELQKNPSNED